MISEIVEKQRKYFQSGATREVDFRKRQLKVLKQIIDKYEQEIYDALRKDLYKGETESFLAEVQIVTGEIAHTLRHIDKWQKSRRVRTPISHFPAGSRIYREPFGSVLILAPWNYPFHLALAPLVGAMAGGNCAVVKLSKNAPNVARVVRTMLREAFSEEYIYCVDEDISYDELINEAYDFIFFTGSERVGKTVMEAAAKHLTPVVLELGGKSPCIVEKNADVALAAKRIAWGKYLNAGQTCVAPDYVLIDECIKQHFITELELEIQKMYGDARKNKEYVHIINAHHFKRLTALLEQEKNKWGGEWDEVSRCISPTIFTEAHFEDPIMREEIFGPILPVISYTDLESALREVQRRPKPLALYLFTKDFRLAKHILSNYSFGSGCLNDVIMQLANHHLPFGGVGSSGMGNYHGRYSFETFTREKGVIVDRGIWDLPLRYPPYTELKKKIIKLVLKK